MEKRQKHDHLVLGCVNKLLLHELSRGIQTVVIVLAFAILRLKHFPFTFLFLVSIFSNRFSINIFYFLFSSNLFLVIKI